jgi:hypothetical protein
MQSGPSKQQLCVSVKMSFLTSRIRTSSGSLSASFLGRANEALDLVLVEPPAGTLQWDDGRSMPLKAVDDIRCCCSIRALLPKELLFCWTEALFCPVSLGALLLFDRNKVPDQAVLDKEGLRLAGLPQWRGLVQCRFLLVLLRQVSKPDVPARSKTVAAQRTEQHLPLRADLRVFLARWTWVARVPISTPGMFQSFLIVGDSAVRLLITLEARSAW